MREQQLSKGQHTRLKILKTAARIFSEKGFSSTKIEDIANDLKIGKGTLYQYFPSKENVFDELIRDGVQQILDRLDQTSTSSRSLEELLENIIYALIDFYVHEFDIMHVYFSVGGSSIPTEKGEPFLPYAKIDMKIAQLLEPYSKVLVGEPVNLGVLTSFFAESIRVTLITPRSLETDEPEILRNIVRAYTRVLMRGILK